MYRINIGIGQVQLFFSGIFRLVAVFEPLWPLRTLRAQSAAGSCTGWPGERVLAPTKACPMRSSPKHIAFEV